ncbi:MAG: hypothetical protein ACEQSH_00790 [Bacteroidia bacterium]
MSIHKRKAILAQRITPTFIRREKRRRWLVDAMAQAFSIRLGDGVRRMAVSSRTATDEELMEASR